MPVLVSSPRTPILGASNESLQPTEEVSEEQQRALLAQESFSGSPKRVCVDPSPWLRDKPAELAKQQPPLTTVSPSSGVTGLSWEVLGVPCGCSLMAAGAGVT